MFDVEREKVRFKKRGWSYRSAAPELGVTYQYLCEVMNGRRASLRLMRRVASLGQRKGVRS